MRKKFSTLWLALVMGTFLVVCGSAEEVSREEQEAPAAAEETGTGEETAAVSSKTAKNPWVEDVKIAYVAHDIGTPNNQAWLEGIESECEYYDNITEQSFNGDSSAEEQVKIMSEIINQGYDAIIIQCSVQNYWCVLVWDMIK